MTEKELWNEYCEKCHIDKNTPHEARCFGDDSDKLAELVCRGIKTATTSWYDLYESESEEKMPEKGDISIILNGKEEAVCIIRDVRVYKNKFREVSEEHAYKEGEGDRSLDYWRKVHKKFFMDEAEEYGLTFDENIDVLCEEFEILYKH